MKPPAAAAVPALAALAFAALALAGCSGAEAPLIDPDWIEDGAITRPLSDRPGDPAEGRAIFAEEARGHCVLCHAVDSLDVPFQGNIGPDLSGIGARRSAGELRLVIADARRVYPGTIMPSYYRIEGLSQVAAGDRGKPVLSAQEVEDVTAYLMTLKPDGA